MPWARSFRLSTRDRAEWVRLLEVAKSDPDLKGLASLGWFVSHARSNLSLSTADVEIYDNFFPALWQITLILQPIDGGPTQAGFFGRETDGSLRMESSYLEFEVEPLKFLKETSQRELVKPSLAKGAIPSEPSSSFGSEAKPEPLGVQNGSGSRFKFAHPCASDGFGKQPCLWHSSSSGCYSKTSIFRPAIILSLFALMMSATR